MNLRKRVNPLLLLLLMERLLMLELLKRKSQRLVLDLTKSQLISHQLAIRCTLLSMPILCKKLLLSIVTLDLT